LIDLVIDMSSVYHFFLEHGVNIIRMQSFSGRMETRIAETSSGLGRMRTGDGYSQHCGTTHSGSSSV